MYSKEIGHKFVLPFQCFALMDVVILVFLKVSLSNQLYNYILKEPLKNDFQTYVKSFSEEKYRLSKASLNSTYWFNLFKDKNVH